MARTIGVLAREAGVNVETIRFYEREGLLRKPPRPTSGWRVYDDTAVAEVRRIRLAHRLGFSTQEIRTLGERLLHGGDACRVCRSLLETHLRATNREILRLTAIRSEIERTLTHCRATPPRESCPFTGHPVTTADSKRSSR